MNCNCKPRGAAVSDTFQTSQTSQTSNLILEGQNPPLINKPRDYNFNFIFPFIIISVIIVFMLLSRNRL